MEDKRSKWAKKKAAQKIKKKAPKEAASEMEMEEEQMWAEAQSMKQIQSR